MSKICEKCGTELSDRAAFCPSCGKCQSDMPAQAAVAVVQKGPLALPRNNLSLTAVILVLAGAIFSNGNWVASVIQNHYRVSILWSVEIILIFAAAAVLFIGYFARIPLKIPMLIWGGAALFGFVSNLVTAIKLWPTKYAAGRIGTYYFIVGLLTAAAALIAILYAFKTLKKIPALVVLGVLLAAVLIMGVVFNLKNFAGYLSINDKNAFLIIRTLFSTLHSLIFSIGIFLTVLSAKEK